MTNINKEWAMALDQAQIDRVLSLGIYNRHAVLLFANVDNCWQDMFRGKQTKKGMDETFRFFFMPFFKMWASTLFVVYEGTSKCGVIDKKLFEVESSMDMDTLRGFRNATFHFQARLSDWRHNEYIAKNGFRSARDLHERQDFVVRKMVRLLKHNPLYHSEALRHFN